MHWDTFEYCLRKQWGLPMTDELKTNIPSEAGARLAEALEPLAGHVSGHDESENALRMKSARENNAPPRTRWRDPVVSTVDFADKSLSHPYVFGLSSVAAGLRKLADAVEAGEVLPQEVTILQKGCIEDFHLTTLTFEYADKQGRPS
jgi:hypothetical protein